MPKPASTRPAYKMLTCIYLCRTLLFFAPYADFYGKKPPDRTFYVRTGDFYEQSLNSQQAGFNKFFYLLSGNRINRLQSIESGISCETELPFSLIYRYATS